MLRKIKRSGAGYVLPAVIVVAVVMLYPLFYTLIMGFFNNTLFMEAPVFCGISQYKKLFGDKVFIGSIANTLFLWKRFLPVWTGLYHGAGASPALCKRKDIHPHPADDTMGDAQYHRFRCMEMDVQCRLWNHQFYFLRPWDH